MFILASASPTRRQMLENAGFDFKVLPADIDERQVEKNGEPTPTNGVATALRLAEAKAKQVSQLHPDRLVIGADQTLIHKDKPLHKPRDLADAARQLTALAGQTHALHAAAVIVREQVTLWSHVATAKLTMRNFSPSELNEVLRLEDGANLHAVGAYRLEGPSVRLFEHIEGDYFTVLGLPLLPLLEGLRAEGISP